MKQPPILVTGAPRSGTTFLGKMLALPRHILYVDEPFNNLTGLEGIRATFPYIPNHSVANEIEGLYTDTVEKLFRGGARFKPSELRPATTNPLRQFARELLVSRENLSYKFHAKNPLKTRYLIKDPMACYLSEYLHQRFDMKTVIIMRHPLSLVASFKRLGWHYDVSALIDRAEYVDAGLKQALESVKFDTLNDIEEWSVLWLVIYGMLQQFMTRNPGMIFITHEELSVNAHSVFGRLYDLLELPFTPQVWDKITEYTNRGNPTEPTGNEAHVLHRNSADNIGRWKHILTSDEANRVRDITGVLADLYYPQTTWL